ncbi:MAG TPA: Rnf-Nqr domain containing protein [Clostridia bacterium]|nr:Rnf-Nqr domain containing protein [Clostridia bacterium]
MFDNLESNKEPLRDVFLKGILVHNPVLVQVIGICPVVAAAVSLRAAALLAGIYTLVLILTEVIASAFLKKTVRWVRVAIYMLIGLAVISPFSYLLEKNDAGIRLTVGIYLSLLAANSLAVLRCEKIAVKHSVKYSFFDALAASIGYSAVFLVAGFVRELLGSGSILDKPVEFIVKTPGMLMPFGGFIVLGFMAAALRAFIIRYYPQYAKAMMIRITPTPVTLKVPKIPVEKDDETVDEPPTANMTAAAPDDGDFANEAEEEPPEQSELDTNTAQNQAESVSDYAGADGNAIDLKFQELIHFLEECDTVPKDKELTDG